VPLDALTGNDQTGKRNCQRIEEKFCHHLAIVSPLITWSHMTRSLQGHMDVCKSCYSRWSGYLEQVRNATPSGCTIDDYVSAYACLNLFETLVLCISKNLNILVMLFLHCFYL
jgi:hypothetical protein